jgi:hypothetical protein
VCKISVEWIDSRDIRKMKKTQYWYPKLVIKEARFLKFDKNTLHLHKEGRQGEIQITLNSVIIYIYIYIYIILFYFFP